MTTPVQRLTRLLSEGARFKVELPGQPALDITPDVVAMLDGLATFSTNEKDRESLGKARNLLETNDLGRVLPTRVHFPRNAPTRLPT